MAGILKTLKTIWAWRSYLVAILAPSLLSLLFLYDGTEYQQQARCTFVLMILVAFWTSECIPIAVTSLLPMFLYPLLKIATAKELAPKYMNEVIMAFMGSYIMVIAFERANLHKRLALKILKVVGPQPRWLLFGTMMSACFLSMFTNNTVSCALHLPIVKGIIDELREASKKQAKIERAAEAAIKPSATVTTLITAVDSSPCIVVHEISEESCCDNKAFEENETAFTPESESSIEHSDPSSPTACSVSSMALSTMVDDDVKPVEAPSKGEDGGSDNNKDGNNEEDNALSQKSITGLEKMLLIAAAYSASIGGMCTLIGTPTNLIMKERVDEVFHAHNCTMHPVTFASWLVIGLPVGYLFIFFAWFWLQIFFLGPKYVYRVWVSEPFRCFFRIEQQVVSRSKLKAQRQAERVSAVINQLNAQLEPMGFRQYAVLGHCVVLVALLITRQMSAGESEEDYVGWGIVAPGFVEESTAAILVTASMFLFPSRWPFSNSPRQPPPPPLLKWSQVEESFPFGVILLLGGGMAATYGAQQSGLPLLIAPFFHNMMKDMSLTLAVLLTSIFVAAMTEVMSNVACVTLISPVMEELAYELHVSPLLFLFPTTLSASFAFMLPVATLPNALVFSTNRLKIKDMILCGLGMNCIGILVVFTALNTWGDAYFSLYVTPCAH